MSILVRLDDLEGECENPFRFAEIFFHSFCFDRGQVCLFHDMSPETGYPCLKAIASMASLPKSNIVHDRRCAGMSDSVVVKLMGWLELLILFVTYRVPTFASKYGMDVTAQIRHQRYRTFIKSARRYKESDGMSDTGHDVSCHFAEFCRFVRAYTSSLRADGLNVEDGDRYDIRSVCRSECGNFTCNFSSARCVISYRRKLDAVTMLFVDMLIALNPSLPSW